jgi:hypothetical protein
MAVGITCDKDPAELGADASWLDDAIAGGAVLPGWAPLAGSNDRTWPCFAPKVPRWTPAAVPGRRLIRDAC